MTYMESTVGACSSFLPQGLLIQPQFCMYLNYPNLKAVLPHAVVSVDMACVCCWLLCTGQVQPSQHAHSGSPDLLLQESQSWALHETQVLWEQ